MLIEYPQSLHVMNVPPAMSLVVVYILQGYASLIENAGVLGGIGSASKVDSPSAKL
jgi:hypothetical protein